MADGKMYWPNTTHVSELVKDESLTNSCEAAIPKDWRTEDGDPLLEAFMTPRSVVFLGEWWVFPISLLLTRSHVIAGRKKGILRKADVHTWSRYDFDKYGTGNDGRDYWVTMRLERGGDFQARFRTPMEADFLADYCRNG